MSFLGLKSLDTLKTKSMTGQVTLILQVHKYNDFWQDPANWMLCYANEVKMLQDPCCCYHGWRGFLHLNDSNSDSSERWIRELRVRHEKEPVFTYWDVINLCLLPDFIYGWHLKNLKQAWNCRENPVTICSSPRQPPDICSVILELGHVRSFRSFRSCRSSSQVPQVIQQVFPMPS